MTALVGRSKTGKLQDRILPALFLAREQAWYYGCDFVVYLDEGPDPRESDWKVYVRGSIETDSLRYSGFRVGKEVCRVDPYGDISFPEQRETGA